MAYIEFEVDDKVDEELFFERMNELLNAVEILNITNSILDRTRVLIAAYAFAKVFDSSIEL